MSELKKKKRSQTLWKKGFVLFINIAMNPITIFNQKGIKALSIRA